MCDARFQAEKVGTTIGFAVDGRSRANLEAGLFYLPTSWSTVRLTATSTINETPNSGWDVFGAKLGGRIHAPTRFSPNIGVSGWMGNASEGQPNDPPAAIIPEAGVSLWATSTSRLNLGYNYFRGTGGAQHDGNFVGLKFDWTPCFLKEKEPTTLFEMGNSGDAEKDYEEFRGSISSYGHKAKSTSKATPVEEESSSDSRPVSDDEPLVDPPAPIPDD